ncbi:MAG: PilZ domain-containing protein [Pseudomonadaceae bacterium]|nr:MAG: PilZ domain-containing protein [Pseudomonadaceae bacterium]
MHAEFSPIPYRRLIERHELSAYLQVFNGYNQRSLGFIGNISCFGLMLHSQLPLQVNAEYQLYLCLPGLDGQAHRLDFHARSYWCRPDPIAGDYASGLQLLTSKREFAQLAVELKCYFSFIDPIQV